MCVFVIIMIILLSEIVKKDMFFAELQKKMAGISSYAQESFAGVRLIRSLVLESETFKKFESLNTKLATYKSPWD